MAGMWLFIGMFLAAQTQKGHYACGPQRLSEAVGKYVVGGDMRVKKVSI